MSDERTEDTGPSEPTAASEPIPTTTAEDERAARERALRAQVESRPTIGVDDFRKRSRRSFLVGAVGVGAAFAGWRWVQDQPTDDGIPQILRDGLEANEDLWRTVSDSRMAPEFPVSKATPLARCSASNASDTIAGAVRAMIRSAASTTRTSRPRPRAIAATSSPM